MSPPAMLVVKTPLVTKCSFESICDLRFTICQQEGEAPARLPPNPDRNTGTPRPRDHRTTRPQNSPQDHRTRLVVSGLVVPWSWSGFGGSLTLPLANHLSFCFT